MKICSKCKIEKNLSEFHKDNISKDKLRNICKQCAIKYSKKYNKNHFDERFQYNKKWTTNNPEKIIEYRKNNKEYHKKYIKSKANYDTFASRISWANDPVRNIDGYLQTKCTYCGKWYFPTNLSVKNRINSLNGNQTGEQRLYCSIECKKACPIYYQKLYPKGFKNYTQTREVQPELRQMVFERDEYTCIKCGKHQDELTVPLHCHHIEGIVQNPIESADIDMCVTVCKTCHNKIHQQEGCGYNDMKCKNKININKNVKGE